MKKTISIVLILALVLALTVEIAKADFTFGTPTSLGQTVNSSYNDHNPSISADGLSLYFISNRTGGIGGTEMYAGCDIWVTTRETIDEAWGIPANLGPTVNSPLGEYGVSISSDGLSLYLDALPPGVSGAEDLYVATRATTEDEWGIPVNLGPTVNSSGDDCYVNISADELALYFTSNMSGGYGGYDLWVTKRETIFAPWGPPVNLGPNVNTSSGEGHPGISPDGRVFFFVCDRSGGYGNEDIWMTRRATTNDKWGEPVNLGSTINSSGWEGFPNVSADGSILYFRYSQTGRYQGGDIWQVPIIPIVDFNADDIVDAADMCIMVDHWGEYYPLCDIGPVPWGDGIVDVEDLKVLAEHLFEEVLPLDLAAYWKLDETEGDIAYDSAAENDAVVFGGALWQPAGGVVDGALAFDGIDDYVNTPYVLNPADAPFSVLAWVKGGAPGQVVISQQAGTNWLMADAEGKLMTELRYSRGRTPQLPLLSQAVITDGQWHRVGFVWDGANRSLYVDGIFVAEDSQFGLAESTGGLNIGWGGDPAVGTYWYGLIDDVRIYNRAINP